MDVKIRFECPKCATVKWVKAEDAHGPVLCDLCKATLNARRLEAVPTEKIPTGNVVREDLSFFSDVWSIIGATGVGIGIVAYLLRDIPVVLVPASMGASALVAAALLKWAQPRYNLSRFWVTSLVSVFLFAPLGLRYFVSITEPVDNIERIKPEQPAVSGESTSLENSKSSTGISDAQDNAQDALVQKSNFSVDSERLVPPKEVIFLSYTPRELMQLFEGLTGHQAKQKLEDFRGKWLGASGQVSNMDSFGDGAGEIVILTSEGVAIRSYLDKERFKGVSHLSKGDEVSLEGEISSIYPGGRIDLDSCVVKQL